jgi:hypothetical protein
MKGALKAIRHLALIALFVRAMMPAGWMPDAHTGLAICSLDAFAHLGVVHHDDAPTTGDKASHEECPFAAAPHLASTPDVPSLIAPIAHAFAAATDRAYAATIVARFAPQSPRAPPLNV